MQKRINSRAKGHKFELQLVKLFKELGWVNCCSSRSESKRLDDAGIDLCYTAPFSVQAKNVERLGNYHEILESMPQNQCNLLFHKRNHKGTVVAMKQENFIELLNMLIEAKVIKPK